MSHLQFHIEDHAQRQGQLDRSQLAFIVARERKILRQRAGQGPAHRWIVDVAAIALAFSSGLLIAFVIFNGHL
jgi:hypothetical protein